MPIHEYVDQHGALHERIFLVGDEIPETIQVQAGVAYRRVSAPTIRFRGPFSAGTPRKHMVTDLGPDTEVLDDGGKRRQKELVREAQDKRDRERTKYIEDSLSTYDI